VKTDDLIVQLARGVTPVTPLPPPSVRLARWVAGMFVVGAAGVSLLGPRPDLPDALREPVYAIRLVITLASALLAASAAFALTIPGAERSRAQRVLPLAAVSGWALFLAVLVITGGDAVARVLAFPVNWPCGYKILGFSLVSGGALFVGLRRGAPLEPTWTACLAALAATAFAAVATQLVCPVDDPAHQLVGHVLPVVVLMTIGAALGSGVLRPASDAVKRGGASSRPLNVSRPSGR
jgi:hypothetical protein